MTRVRRHAVETSLILLLVLLTGAITSVRAQTPAELIAQADLAYASRHELDSMTLAIHYLEQVLPELESLSLDTQTYVLNRLSQLCYEATTLSEGKTPEDKVLYEKGKAYGLQSLRLNPAFADAEDRDFNEAVSYVTDAGALLWLADSWGQLLGLNPIEGLLQQGKVLALFSRSVELDPEYWGGSASNALGSLLVMSPAALGGDKEAGLAHIENAIAIDPTYLPNHVVLAEYWGFTYNFLGQRTGIRDADLIRRELNFVLDAELGIWPFWNRNAKKSAERLLGELEEMLE